MNLLRSGEFFVLPPFKIFKSKFDNRTFLVVNSDTAIDTIDEMLMLCNLSNTVLLQTINVSDVNYSRLKAYKEHFAPVAVGVYVEDRVLHDFIIAASVLLGAEVVLLPPGYGSADNLKNWIETLKATVEAEVVG